MSDTDSSDGEFEELREAPELALEEQREVQLEGGIVVHAVASSRHANSLNSTTTSLLPHKRHARSRTSSFSSIASSAFTEMSSARPERAVWHVDRPDESEQSPTLPRTSHDTELQTKESASAPAPTLTAQPSLSADRLSVSAFDNLPAPERQSVSSSVEKKKKRFGFFTRKKEKKTTLAGVDKLSSMVRTKQHKRQSYELTDLRLIQQLQAHSGPIWTMAFSPDGRYLATGGQDSVVRVWAILEDGSEQGETEVSKGRNAISLRPVREFSGHTSDVTDLAWSRANFLLSGSMDQCVMLWHVRRERCLCLFQHTDFVTTVAFHPVDDTLFLSGSFDKKLRLWNILEHRVVDWLQLGSRQSPDALVTSAAFSPNGRVVAVGLFAGKVMIYETHGMKYVTQIDCRNRHGRFKDGRKVTGLEFSPDGRLLLVSTNDSRVRLYDLADYSMVSKFKGHSNEHLQIAARFADEGRRVITGSDDGNVFLWDVRVAHPQAHAQAQLDDESPLQSPGALLPQTTTAKESTRRKYVRGGDRNSSFECFKAHDSAIPVALQAPLATLDLSQKASNALVSEQEMQRVKHDNAEVPYLALPIRHLIVTCDEHGLIRVFENRGMPEGSG